MRLEAPPHGTDELSSALVYEAGIFSGMESAPYYHSGPFGLVNGVSGALAELVDIAAQVTMLVQAIGGLEQIKKRDPKSLTLIGLAFAPTLITKLSDFVYSFDEDDDEYEQHEEDVTEFENVEYLMREIATSTKYKQEATLFGLHDWCLKTWDKAREMLQAQSWEQSFQSQAKSVGFKLLNEMAGTAFYVSAIPLILLTPGSACHKDYRHRSVARFHSHVPGHRAPARVLCEAAVQPPEPLLSVGLLCRRIRRRFRTVSTRPGHRL